MEVKHNEEWQEHMLGLLLESLTVKKKKKLIYHKQIICTMSWEIKTCINEYREVLGGKY